MVHSNEQRFEEALKIFGDQVAEATQFWFAAATMNEVARRDNDTLEALNLTPSFWITARVAMEYQAILCMSLISQAAKALPNASRRALRWMISSGFSGHPLRPRQ